MITMNSISGGKTSAYICANYPADYNIFSLVWSDHKKNKYQGDSFFYKWMCEKLGFEWFGTLEDDIIIKTIYELEQYTGNKIHCVAGISFDELVKTKGGWLPNKLHRYCTQFMKLQPIFDFWLENIHDPVEVRIGFRANEMRRAKNTMKKLNKNGFLEQKYITGKTKTGNSNTWGVIEWQKPVFPLISDVVFKDQIEEFWKGKPVEFAPLNNCVGCFHRNELLLKKMYSEHPLKMSWFEQQEGGKKGFWKHESKSYKKIKDWNFTQELQYDDFSDCDSGYCGL